MKNLPRPTPHTSNLRVSAHQQLPRITRLAIFAGALCLAANSFAMLRSLTSGIDGLANFQGSTVIGNNIAGINTIRSRGLAFPVVLISSGFAYTTNNGTATIVGCYTPVTNGNTVIASSPLPDTVVIPPTLEGLPVTEIGPSAFYSPIAVRLTPAYAANASSPDPTNIFIPASVTSIDSSAFSSAWNLTAIHVDPANPAYRSIDGALLSKNLTTLLRCPKAREGDFTVPDGVVTIAPEAFSGCSKLSRILFPDSVKEIGSGAFQYCQSLIEVLLPESLTTIGANAFRGCSSLTAITLPPGLTRLESSTFEYCGSLTAIHFPAGLTSIGDGAFSSCQNLSSIAIPDSVTHIEARAFAHCQALTSVRLPSGLTTINPGTFESCYRLSNVSIPASVTHIAERAFAGCDSLTRITLPNRVQSVGNDAFSSCYQLTAVEIPASLTDIAAGAFSNCRNLAHLTVAPENPAYTSQNGVLFDKHQSVLVLCPASRSGHFLIPDTVTRIGAAAFSGCYSLTSITLPEGVTDIGDNAFESCQNLTALTLPSSLLHLGDRALRYCTALTELVIPENTSGSLNDLLSGCYALRHLTLPAGVTPISSTAFNDCQHLLSIAVNPGNPAYVSLNGVLFNKDLTALVHYPKGRPGGFALPEGVREIPAGAFAWYANLTAISLPHSLTNIANCAFAHCTSLAEVIIPPTVLHIGDSAFAYCTNLTSLTIPEGVTTLGSYAFSGCSLLTSVWIPASLTNIAGWPRSRFSFTLMLLNPPYYGGSTVFSNCPRLREINVAPGNPALYSQDGVLFTHGAGNVIGGLLYRAPTLLRSPEAKTGNYSIPTHITSIAPAAFENCAGLTSVTIQQGVTQISDHVFTGCSNLTTVTLPQSLTSIGTQSFLGCSSLPSITIPNTVTAIGAGAFTDCSHLTNVFLPEALSAIGSEAFAGCTSLLTLQIPASVTQIGPGAFRPGPASFLRLAGESLNVEAANLQSIDVDPLNPLYSSLEGVLFNKDQSVLIQYPMGKPGIYTVPETVARIEPLAFTACTGLTGIILPPRLSEIPGSAFADCTSLQTAELPDTITSIGAGAFRNCSSLTGTTLPPNAQLAGNDWDGIFANCTSLKSIVVPGCTTEIPQQTFANCTSLAKVTLEEGVQSIGAGAFSGCTSLTRIAIPASVQSIDPQAFAWSLTSLTAINVSPLNPSYCSVDGVLFNKARTVLITFPPAKAGHYVIPEGVTSVDTAFSDCTRLTRLDLPASVTDMNPWAFSGCPNLTAIGVAPANPAYRSTHGVLFDKTGTTLIQYPRGRTGAYSVPEGVTQIAYAFYGCRGLTHLSIPASVVTLDEYSLSDCPNLGAIHVDPLNPAYLSLGGALFDKAMTRLIRCPTSVTGSYVIPPTVSHVSEYAFAHCTKLTALTVPAQINQVVSYDNGLWGCTNLQSVFMQGNAPSQVWFWPETPKSSPTIYYLSGTEGWGTALAGLPTALWNPSIGTDTQNLGIGEVGFGFNFTAASGLVVVVEACTDLAHPTWIPVSTNSLPTGTSTFQDPNWLNHPGRFYRLRSLNSPGLTQPSDPTDAVDLPHANTGPVSRRWQAVRHPL